MTGNLYLIIGRNGSGKNTLVDGLCERYGYNKLCSYTSREKRGDELDNRHIYSTYEDYCENRVSNNIAAETSIKGDVYWATHEQVDNNDIYIIDEDGIVNLKYNYHGNRPFKVIYVEASPDICYNRMILMLPSTFGEEEIDQVVKRDYYNRKTFTNDYINKHSSKIDFVLKNEGDIESGIAALKEIIDEAEKTL